jgi:hypothetical protein
MGNQLQKPVTDKTTETHVAHGIDWAVTGMQGYRVSMEVRSMISLSTRILNMSDKLPSFHRAIQDTHTLEYAIDSLPGCTLVGVFDGHGGRAVAELRSV